VTELYHDIIDIHAHLGKYHQFPLAHCDAGDVVQQADELGIRILCVSHMYGLLYDVREGNTLSREAARQFPGRILAGGVLDPRESEEEIENEFNRCEPHVAMWNELHPALHRSPINGPGYTTILSLINTKPKPVLVHTDEDDPYSRPDLLEEVVPRFPALPFLIGHSGNVIGGFEKAVDLALKYENVYLDSTFSRNFLGVMEWLIKKVGAEKILFGSDMPFLNASAQVGKLLSVRITESQRERIFRENARGLLKLDSMERTSPKFS